MCDVCLPGGGLLGLLTEPISDFTNVRNGSRSIVFERVCTGY